MRLALAVLTAALCLYIGGCARIGSTAKFDRTSSDLVNQSPVTLNIQDDNKIGTAVGVGPARWTKITGDEVTTFQTGSTPRDMFITKKPDGTLQFNLSSGTDFNGEGLEFNAATGSFKVAKFGTSSSEPLRAGNEAYDRLVGYWNSRDQASKEAIIKGIEAGQAVSPEFFALIRAAIGVP